MQALIPDLREAFELATGGLDESELGQLRGQINAMSKMSKALRPSIQAFGRAIDLLLTISHGIATWAE